MINNLNLKALQDYIDLVKSNSSEAVATFGVTANWQDGVATEITPHSKKVGSKKIITQFKYLIDEPLELLGNDKNPNPQDYILGGMAGCMMVGFVAGASGKGIELRNVQLDIIGELDLRGFLNLDPDVNVGFEKLQFNFKVEGSGTQDQYDEIIEHVRKFSPGYQTILNPVKILTNKEV
ncbi:OsmC family protein [Crocinitomix catalasitica]|uniref:OsmC family protein n=1 Tax=Crocinitomix catalasitica TaxID=184607 RepID=UPI00056D328B|nr:OsmC family protein [Crocinitomix catalasitica]